MCWSGQKRKAHFGGAVGMGVHVSLAIRTVSSASCCHLEQQHQNAHGNGIIIYPL